MAEEEGTIDLGKSGLTVSEYLFRLPYYEGRARVVGTQRWAVRSDPHDAENPLRQPDHGIGGMVSLVPKLPYLPAVSAEVLSGFADRRNPHHGGAAATLSLSSKNVPVSYSREYRDGTYKDIVRGQAGDFRAFVSELKGDGERDLVESAIGASARMGPVELFGEQSRASWEDRDPWTGQLLRNMEYARHLENTRIDARNRKIGAEIKGPLGKGVAGLKVARAYRKILLPNRRGQPRPTVSAPHTTSLGGHWQGPLGPGRLDLSGGADFIQGKGTSPYAKGSYAMEDPLGLGGRFNVNVGWQNPYGGPSDLQAGVRYTLPLHRLR